MWNPQTDSQAADTLAASIERLNSTVSTLTQQLDTTLTVYVSNVPKGGAQWTDVAGFVVGFGAMAVALVALWKEFRRDRERRRAIDARIGDKAFVLMRQIQSWIDEVPSTFGAKPHVIAELLRWKSGVDGQAPVYNAGFGDEAARWARERAVHYSSAEERFGELAEVAPEASAVVSKAVREAYVWFYNATGHLNTGLLAFEKGDISKGADDLCGGYCELQEAVKKLRPAVTKEFLAERIMRDVSDPVKFGEATNLDVEVSASDP